MRFFSDFDDSEIEKFFYKKPVEFNKYSDREVLSYGLGATLYMPATKPGIGKDIIGRKYASLTSLVICLEDAIGDNEVEKAERLFIEHISAIHEALRKEIVSYDDLPLIFVRIRNFAQFKKIVSSLGEKLAVAAGVVIPKFSREIGEPILKLVQRIHNEKFPFYAMPIFETKQIIYKETRMAELLDIKTLLDEYKEIVLNIRIGATDFSGLFGIRRNSYTPVYEISIIRDCIADILNVFLRLDEPYVISGPVWEYFSARERLLKPQIRQTPFAERYGEKGLEFRKEIIHHDMDGFIREIMMDIDNGIVGKTIIHPTHIRPVQALNTVSYEEFIDAKNIIDENNGNAGVKKSAFSNKMNEIKPHFYWAKKILRKSETFGVLRDEFTYIDLLKQKSFI